MVRNLCCISLCLLCLMLIGVQTTDAAGRLQIPKLTAEPSPVIPGDVVAPLTSRIWDVRCQPSYRVNSTLDPIPNPLGEDFLSVAEALSVLQAAAQAWSDIPTAYIDLTIDGTVANPGSTGLDFKNEITFRTGSRFAGSFTRRNSSLDFEVISHVIHTTVAGDFFAPAGLDADGDGDPDIVAGIETCADTDGDGDIEYPEGAYLGATIIDSDLDFSSGVDFEADPSDHQGYRFTADSSAADDDPLSIDLYALAITTLGQALTLAHSPINQRGPFDGHSATLYTKFDTGDGAAELSRRIIDIEAATTLSYAFPEGTAETGPAALQEGDVAFDEVFGLIKGTVHHGELDQPLAGANVFAVNAFTGRVVNTALSADVVFSQDPVANTGTVVSAEFNILNGNYTLPVPAGLYYVGVEPIDDEPTTPESYNRTVVTGWLLEQNNFSEEFYNGRFEKAYERRPNAKKLIFVRAGQTVEGIDIITNKTEEVAHFGTLDSYSTGPEGSRFVAVHISADDFSAADLNGRSVLHGAEFLTSVNRRSSVPVFNAAYFATGTVNSDGTATINLRRPLERRIGFAGQEDDFSPWYFRHPLGVANRVRNGIGNGSIQDLFLVLQLPANSNRDSSPRFGIDGGVDDNDVAIFGRSYYSSNGRAFIQDTDHNYMFKLVLGERR